MTSNIIQGETLSSCQDIEYQHEILEASSQKLTASVSAFKNPFSLDYSLSLKATKVTQSIAVYHIYQYTGTDETLACN